MEMYCFYYNFEPLLPAEITAGNSARALLAQYSVVSQNCLLLLPGIFHGVPASEKLCTEVLKIPPCFPRQIIITAKINKAIILLCTAVINAHN